MELTKNAPYCAISATTELRNSKPEQHGQVTREFQETERERGIKNTEVVLLRLFDAAMISGQNITARLPSR